MRTYTHSYITHVYWRYILSICVWRPSSSVKSMGLHNATGHGNNTTLYTQWAKPTPNAPYATIQSEWRTGGFSAGSCIEVERSSSTSLKWAENLAGVSTTMPWSPSERRCTPDFTWRSRHPGLGTCQTSFQRISSWYQNTIQSHNTWHHTDPLLHCVLQGNKGRVCWMTVCHLTKASVAERSRANLQLLRCSSQPTAPVPIGSTQYINIRACAL